VQKRQKQQKQQKVSKTSKTTILRVFNNQKGIFDIKKMAKNGQKVLGIKLCRISRCSKRLMSFFFGVLQTSHVP